MAGKIDSWESILFAIDASILKINSVKKKSILGIDSFKFSHHYCTVGRQWIWEREREGYGQICVRVKGEYTRCSRRKSVISCSYICMKINRVRDTELIEMFN